MDWALVALAFGGLGLGAAIVWWPMSLKLQISQGEIERLNFLVKASEGVQDAANSQIEARDVVNSVDRDPGNAGLLLVEARVTPKADPEATPVDGPATGPEAVGE